LITGGSRGIGKAIALALGRSGYDCAVNFAVNAQAAEKTVTELGALGARAIAVQADIGNSADRRRLVHETLSGLGPIDLLVNNAGVAPTLRADLLEASEQSFDRLINTNLKGPYFLTQLVARHMLDRSGGQPAAGKIVTITSISAEAPSVNRGDYCVSKAGLAMMTRLFAARLAEHGIGVYEIRPGIIETDMTGPVKEKYDKLIAAGLTPIARWGTPEDVAKAVTAIAMDLLPFSTGEVINVDGGFHLRRL
jgi:NAD(P)-dependent dehydrogenase (short-subunit alcohol dehydrogenase family)